MKVKEKSLNSDFLELIKGKNLIGLKLPIFIKND